MAAVSQMKWVTASVAVCLATIACVSIFLEPGESASKDAAETKRVIPSIVSSGSRIPVLPTSESPARKETVQPQVPKNDTKSDNATGKKRAPLTRKDLLAIPVTDAEVEAEARKQMKDWATLPERTKVDLRKDIRYGIQGRKLFGTAGGKKGSLREDLTESRSDLKPMAAPDVLKSWVEAHESPGAFIAAAGASRDESWLDKGLAKFPNAASLMRAKALMDFRYLKDPTLIDAWRSADSASGWPDILAADLAFGQNQPRQTYEALQKALAKNIDFTGTPEIKDLIKSIGNSGSDDHFGDIGDDGTRFSREFALQLKQAALGGRKAADSDNSWIYYAGAALALYDLKATSGNSDDAMMAANSARDMLKILGPTHAPQFLDDKSYAEGLQFYSGIVSSAKTAKSSDQ